MAKKIAFSRVREGSYPGEFLISEANGTRSRDTVVVAADQSLVSGQVLAVNEAGTYVAWDGTSAAAGVALYPVETGDSTDTTVAFTRDCEVAAHSLAVPEGADPEQAATELEQIGIIVR